MTFLCVTRVWILKVLQKIIYHRFCHREADFTTLQSLFLLQDYLDEKGLKFRRFLTKVFKRLESIPKRAKQLYMSVNDGP